MSYNLSLCLRTFRLSGFAYEGKPTLGGSRAPLKIYPSRVNSRYWLYIILIYDIQKVINENNGIIAPEDFMRKVINISVGGARGMLAVKLAKTPLSHITLPLLDTGSLKQEKN